MGTAFFSYSRVDSDFALKLAKDLRKAGVDLWIDQIDIKPGSHWDASIETALNAADCMIIILSPDSIASHNVMDEVSYALEGQKRVIPVLWRDCTPSFRLRRLQRIDFTGDYKSGFEHLMEALNPGTYSGNPDNLFLEQFEKSKAYYEKEEFDIAEKYINEALKIKPSSEEAINLKISIEQSLKRKKDAESDHLFLEQFGKAKSYYEKEDYHIAEKYIIEALKIKPASDETINLKISIEQSLKRKKNSELEQLFQDAFSRAKLNFERKDYKTAKKYADEALKLKPGNKEVPAFLHKSGIEDTIKKQKRNQLYIYIGIALFLVGLFIMIIFLTSNSSNPNSESSVAEDSARMADSIRTADSLAAANAAANAAYTADSLAAANAAANAAYIADTIHYDTLPKKVLK